MTTTLKRTKSNIESIADKADEALKQLYTQYPRLEAKILHTPQVFSHRQENKGLKRQIRTLESTIDTLERGLKRKTKSNDNLIASINSLANELATVTEKLSSYDDCFPRDLTEDLTIEIEPPASYDSHVPSSPCYKPDCLLTL